MKSNFSNLAGIVGVTGICLLMNSPVGAKQAVKLAKKNPSHSVAVHKTGKDALNPSPTIFQECPYNQSACNGSNTNNSNSTAPLPSTPTDSQVPITNPTTQPTPGLGKPSIKPSAGNRSENLVMLAQANGYTTLAKALKAAGLDQKLSGKGPFTLFAPTDAAFAKLPKDAMRDLLKPENREVLVKILTYHVVPGELLSSDLKPGEVKSAEGGPIIVKVDPGKNVMVDDAKVIQPDIKGSNGVIHGINQVILPPDL